MGAPKGAIITPDSGTVIQVGWNGGYGNTVMINHGNNIVTLTHMPGHISEYRSKSGKGQAIAKRQYRYSTVPTSILKLE